jgi:hypothetical protein
VSLGSTLSLLLQAAVLAQAGGSRVPDKLDLHNEALSQRGKKGKEKKEKKVEVWLCHILNRIRGLTVFPRSAPKF